VADSVAGLFETACRWIGGEAFLSDPDHRLSGRAAGAAVRSAAAALARAGLGPGGVAAFLCGPSVAHAVGFFAVQAAGGVACALHLRETDARLGEVLAALAPRLLLADRGTAGRAAALAAAAAIPCLILEDLAGGAEELAPLPRAPDAPSVILLSSGTTGLPKLVEHSQATVLATASQAPACYGALGPGDGIVVPMAPSFAAWLHVVLPFVAIRGRITFQPRWDAAAYPALLNDSGATVAALVPTLWRQVVAAIEAVRPARLRVAMFSGEAGSPELVARLAGLCTGLRSAYLASETGCAAGLVADRAMLLRAPRAAGQPVPGADALVIDPDAAAIVPLPPGRTGEIALRGPSLARGYRGDPAATLARFAGGWWRTGDLGQIEDGLVHVAGRLDNRITTGGIKVHAEVVEAAILALPGVAAAAVVGMPDAVWGERIEAHVVADRPVEALAAALASAGGLPRTHLPKAWHRHAGLPAGPTGKLYRRALKEGR
jgi:acyl-CoA synthetase (AMP-forming)/AMP-acid ligase II